MNIKHVVYHLSFSLGDKVKIGISNNGWPIFAKVTGFKEDDDEILVYATNANGEFLHAKAYKDGQTLIYEHRNLAPDKVGDFESGEKVVIVDDNGTGIEITRHIIDVDSFNFYTVAYEGGGIERRTYSHQDIFRESDRVGNFFKQQRVHYVTNALNFVAVEEGKIVDKKDNFYIITPGNSNIIVEIPEDNVFLSYYSAAKKHDVLVKERYKRKRREPRA